MTLFGFVSYGQKPEFSQSTMTETDKMINEGTAFDKGKEVKAFILVYTGNIEEFIMDLEKDLGKAEIIHAI